MSLGLTAEKDRGEEFFKGSNPYGFDFYSFHFALRQYTQSLKALVVGDFTANFGQGLVLAGGFQGGKGGTGVGVKRSGRSVAPYTSVNEDAHFRGLATTLVISRALEFTGFVSRVRRPPGRWRRRPAAGTARPAAASFGGGGVGGRRRRAAQEEALVLACGFPSEEKYISLITIPSGVLRLKLLDESLNP